MFTNWLLADLSCKWKKLLKSKTVQKSQGSGLTVGKNGAIHPVEHILWSSGVDDVGLGTICRDFRLCSSLVLGMEEIWLSPGPVGSVQAQSHKL